MNVPTGGGFTPTTDTITTYIRENKALDAEFRDARAAWIHKHGWGTLRAWVRATAEARRKAGVGNVKLLPATLPPAFIRASLEEEAKTPTASVAPTQRCVAATDASDTEASVSDGPTSCDERPANPTPGRGAGTPARPRRSRLSSQRHELRRRRVARHRVRAASLAAMAVIRPPRTRGSVSDAGSRSSSDGGARRRKRRAAESRLTVPPSWMARPLEWIVAARAASSGRPSLQRMLPTGSYSDMETLRRAYASLHPKATPDPTKGAVPAQARRVLSRRSSRGVMRAGGTAHRRRSVDGGVNRAARGRRVARR